VIFIKHCPNQTFSIFFLLLNFLFNSRFVLHFRLFFCLSFCNSHINVSLELFRRLVNHGLDFRFVLHFKFEYVGHNVFFIHSDGKQDLVMGFSLLHHHDLLLDGGWDSGAHWEGVNHPNLKCKLVLLIKLRELQNLLASQRLNLTLRCGFDQLLLEFFLFFWVFHVGFL